MKFVIGNNPAINALVRTIQNEICPTFHNLLIHIILINDNPSNTKHQAILGHKKIFRNKNVVCVIPARNRWELVNLANFI